MYLLDTHSDGAMDLADTQHMSLAFAEESVLTVGAGFYSARF